MQSRLAACGGAGAEPRAGNIAGPEARVMAWPARLPTFAETDPFPRTAPVGSFPAESHGLHDLSGNITEWVNDNPAIVKPYTNDLRNNVWLRAAAFPDGTPDYLAFATIRPVPPGKRLPFSGFRVVLELKTGNPPQAKSDGNSSEANGTEPATVSPP